MSIAQEHENASAFIARWQGKGNEKQETQKFWLDLMQNVLNVEDAINQAEFEHKTASGGFIDMLYPDARFLVEQKSLNVDLDKPEERQGTSVTPVEQALRYANALPSSQKPTMLCTCNFDQFRFYNLEEDPLAQHSPIEEFTLDKLTEHLSVFRSIFSPSNSRTIIEKQLSEKAGLLVANIHDALCKQYVNPDSETSLHSLAILTVRIVFCLYAEDAKLFEFHAFSNYLAQQDIKYLRDSLQKLFTILDTKEKDRDPYLDKELESFG